MFKPELWQSHGEYRTIISKFGRSLSRNYPKYSFNDYDGERQKLLNLNLDPLTVYIPDFYLDGGRPAKHHAQILRSLVLFILLLNKTKARTSLTLWVRQALPQSIALTVLIGCTSTKGLPPLASYYDFMNRFWMPPRDNYSHSALLPGGRNGKKPKRIIGADGKLAGPEGPCTITTRDSEQYKAVYSEHTACERTNNRMLNGYCLQHLKIRGRDHFSFWSMLAGICIHFDARYKAAHIYAA